jgi:SAM-dependent methyltransferase
VATRLYTTEAELYDIAFSWDIAEEVDWLLDRLGGNAVRSILEPACGAGRILEGFARRNVRAVGIDVSPAMIELAAKRFAGTTLPAEPVLADMVSFHLDRVFDGAVCPIDSLACLLDPLDLVSHLDSVARHLRPGAKYLVQLELRDPDDPWTGVASSEWEAARGDVELRITWTVEDIDLDRGVETQRSRIEILAGPARGDVLEETHTMAAWTPERWAAAVSDSPFAYAAVFDGDADSRPPKPLGSSGRLLWHELVR